MFTFDATPVKFIGLFILFAFTTAWGLFELTRPAERRARISGVLHLWMSVVMLLMVSTAVWRPFVKVVPLPVIAATQILSVLWFVWLAYDTRANRALAGHYAGHAMMFAAMSWHLLAMGVKMPQMGPNMGPWMMAESKPGGILWWFALVGVPFMAWLLYAAGKALWDAVAPAPAPVPVAHAAAGPHVDDGDACCQTDAAAPGATAVATRQLVEVAGCHEARVVGTPVQRLGRLHDFAMNFGMFWMSTGLMLPVLPFMAALAF